jgi:hypothetical protein
MIESELLQARPICLCHANVHYIYRGFQKNVPVRHLGPGL